MPIASPSACLLSIAPAFAQEAAPLADLSDAELRSKLAGVELARAWDMFGATSVHDACLLEMVRRGGEEWASFLRAELAARRSATGTEVFLGVAPDLELSTALRRIEGRRDPLAVEVRNREPLELSFPELPTYEVWLANVDEGGESFGLTLGGNYRSGRLARFRVALADAGSELGVRKDWPLGLGGGLSTRGRLRPGAFWDRRGLREQGEPEPLPLALREYAVPRGPGRHVVRIQYHDHVAIAGADDVSGLVLSSSVALELTWLVREVRLTAQDRARIGALVDGASREEPVLGFEPFRDGMEFDRGPENAFEALYREGWKGLAVLLDAVLEREVAVERRAALLVALANVSGLLTPRARGGALGTYHVLPGDLAAGTGSRGGSTVREDGPDARAQEAIVDGWRRYRGMIRVVE